MHPPWEMTIDRPRSSTFLMYMLLHDVGEDYWSISYFFITFFLTRREDYLSFFFIASNLAPWPACCPYDRRLLADMFFYRVQLGSGRMHPSVHVRTYFIFIAYNLDPGACIRRCMYAHNVRACTLYVGQQVCACLHPVRGVYCYRKCRVQSSATLL